MSYFVRKSWKSVLGVVACLAVAGVAYASVTLTVNGEGSVGKGDVQTPCGYNNAKFQANAAEITFKVNITGSQDFVCFHDNNHQYPLGTCNISQTATLEKGVNYDLKVTGR